MKQVTKKDLKRLRLTCKYLGDIFKSQVLHTMHFSIEHHNYSRAAARLQSLATTAKNISPPRGLSRSGRHLHIGSLSPRYFGRITGYDYVGDDELVPVFPTPQDGLTVLAVEELIRMYLCDALNTLRSLQSVTYACRYPIFSATLLT
jgi:hypothetical protein